MTNNINEVITYVPRTQSMHIIPLPEHIAYMHVGRRSAEQGGSNAPHIPTLDSYLPEAYQAICQDHPRKKDKGARRTEEKLDTQHASRDREKKKRGKFRAAF